MNREICQGKGMPKFMETIKEELEKAAEERLSKTQENEECAFRKAWGENLKKCV